MSAPFSPFVKQGNYIFVSGQIHQKDGKLVEGTVEEKTHLIMKNLQYILEQAGATFNDVVKTTIYTTDMALYSNVNGVYASYFAGHFPAREMIGVRELPLGAVLEISMIAYIADSRLQI
jgi:2-iminobutanoate/2-iminopropanoate deaminase